MKQSIRQHWLAISVVIVAAVVVAACGQVTTSEEAPVARRGLRAAEADDRQAGRRPTCASTATRAARRPVRTGSTAASTARCATQWEGGSRSRRRPSPRPIGAGSPAPTFDATAEDLLERRLPRGAAGHVQLLLPRQRGRGRGRVSRRGAQDRELRRHAGREHALLVRDRRAACTACHGNPPANGSDGSNAWHSGFHANNQNVGATGPQRTANSATTSHEARRDQLPSRRSAANGVGAEIAAADRFAAPTERST